jgi:hypothetical protein
MEKARVVGSINSSMPGHEADDVDPRGDAALTTPRLAG